MASTKSRYSASSGVSRPATSESEGLIVRYNLEDDDGGGDQDDETGEPDASITLQTSKKKVSSGKKKRDDALKSEVRLLYLQSQNYILQLTTCIYVASYHESWH